VEHIELICSQCHGMLHQTFTNETLARVYSTIDTLRRCVELQGYLRWVRKQPASRRTRTAPRRRRL
jgi:5-methylcytosine-specific restriction protein A